MGDVVLFKPAELKLIRNTVARDLDQAEFDLFVHMCRQWRLDPMRRQIYAIVYNKDKREKRRVSYVTGIDGYRTIADRTGNYRPGQRSVELGEKHSASNPQGIFSATASVWKRSHGEWHEYSETVWWEEYAPLREVWAFDAALGKKQPTGEYELDRSGQWAKMGRVMLMKCAEAAAIRRGWPDELSDLYIHEEMDKARVIDITPSEAVDEVERQERESKLGGPTVLVDWLDHKPLEAVPAGEFHGRVQDFIRRNAEDEPSSIAIFADRNRESLRQFWGMKPDEALSLKKAFETYQRIASAEASS